MRASLFEHLKRQIFRYFGVSIFVVLGAWSSFQLCLEVGSSGCGWLQDLYRNRPSLSVPAASAQENMTPAGEASSEMEKSREQGTKLVPIEEIREEDIRPSPDEGEEGGDRE
mgnify:CR=1 FL=1